MLKIDGIELIINKNKGIIGIWEYEKNFNRSLTDDLIKTVGNGTLNSIKYDAMFFYRVVYIMAGQDKIRTFENFINKVPDDYDFLNDFTEVIDKSLQSYMPSQTPSTEERTKE